MQSMPLTSGQTFAGYTIIRLLGSGGMGEIYLAQHPRLPRRDALKLLPPDWSADAEYRARFNREADLASTLWHPHIVGVHDRGEHDGQLWISMDFVDGLDAARLLAARYPAGMPASNVAQIVTAVASALDAAHKQGLLHRDVKPANIMLTHTDDDGEQRILLTDFGIARNVNDISGLTATNTAVGTVAYCAPEQLLGEELDGRADQYALAATAHHLLTGSPLFSNSNPAVVISRHLNTPPPSLGESRPDLAELEPVLAAGLAKRPEDRFARCSDFARALAEAIGTTGIPASAPTAPASIPKARSAQAVTVATPTVQNAPRRRSTAAIALMAATAGLLLLGGVVALIVRPWQQQPPPAAVPAPSPSVAAQPSPTLPPVPPPPPSTFPASAVDQVLLSPSQLSKILGVDVTDNPSSGPNALAIDASSYGTSDHASQVTPQSCVGVVYTGEHEVYSTAGPPALKTQSFGSLYGGADGPHLVQQTAAVFPSIEEARAFLEKSLAQWNSCAPGQVQAILGYENGADYTVGSVERQGDLITVAMAKNDGLNGPDACQQALGVRENVVVEARTCEAPKVSTAFDPSAGFPKDPRWAEPDAERVATAMLENIQS